MRIALVSPYSWTYPGGVTRHIEALAESYLEGGHHVRVLAPFDADDRLAVALHRGARPQAREAPDYLIPLGRTVGFPANGAVSNLAVTPEGVAAMRRELRAGGFDVVHLHEPVAPALCWDATTSTDAPLVGTFHCYSTSALANNAAVALGARRRFNRLHKRIAVSEAAAWTARRFFGGRYTIVPNGVELPPAVPRAAPRGGELRILFVGQAVERKGLPVLLRAFEALRDHIPARLVVVGAREEEIAPLLLDARGVTALGKIDDDRKGHELANADVLCAPSLGGESFGMVLTEAFAHGTPVVASDIAGYRDVVRDGVEGMLVPAGDPTQLAEALRDLHLDPRRRSEMGEAAVTRARRYAWPAVADEVLGVYEEALAAPRPEGARQRLAVRAGTIPADLGERVPAERLASLEPAPAETRRRHALGIARRAGAAVAVLGGVGLAALGLEHIGVDKVARSLIDSSPTLVLLGLAIMCASMALRAVSWHAILRAALPGSRVRLRDALQGTFIGVLMSATLPARLGEPSRALIVARRTGRPRENLPAVVGTLVSQTLLNLVALLVLGAVMFNSIGLFQGHSDALVAVSVAPLALLVLVLLAPAVLSRGPVPRSSRLHGLLRRARAALLQVRSGLSVFRRPRLGTEASAAQLGAWGLQWLSCYVLLVALGLDAKAGVGAAAAVLFAVNVTAVLPATPSNLGVFQAACVAVLHGGFGVSSADALAYGIVLQAVEIATAIVMGMPALVKEGLSWRDVRLRAMHTAPVELAARSVPRPAKRSPVAEAEARA